MLLFYPCIVRRTSSEAGVCRETKLPAAHLFRKGCAALRQSVPRPGGPGAGADRGKSGSFPKASNRSARRLECVRVRLVGGGFYDDIPQRATPSLVDDVTALDDSLHRGTNWMEAGNFRRGISSRPRNPFRYAPFGIPRAEIKRSSPRRGAEDRRRFRPGAAAGTGTGSSRTIRRDDADRR